MDAQWQRCYDLFLQSIYDRSGSLDSLISYRSTLKRFFSDPLKSPADYTRTDVLEFLAVPSVGKRTPGQPVSASTKNQRLCVISGFYKFASLYEVNDQPLFQKALPTRGLRQMKRDVTYRAMSEDELRRFFAAIPSTIKGLRMRALFLCYFWTARRRAEIYALRWQDIEPAILIDPDGTSRAGYIYRFRAKGSSRQVRTAELPLPAWQAIQTYLKAAGRLTTIKPDEPIFLSSHQRWRNRPFHDDYINTLFKDVCRKAGLSDCYSLHSLRHTASRLRYEAGQDIRSIQQLLGHANISTTDLYLRTLSGTSDPGAALLVGKFGSL